MKKRLYFIPAFIIVLTLFIVGSIYDLNISKAIAKPRNAFTLFFAALATLPISAFFAFNSGVIFKMNFRRYKECKTYQRILLIALSIVLFAGGTLLFGLNVSGQYAYNFNKLLGILVGLALSVPMAILGYFVYEKIDTPNLLKILIFTSIVVAFTSGCVEFIKILVPRVRFIAVSGMIDGEALFRPWYNPSITKPMIEQVKDWASQHGYGELYKSFPSGHSNFSLSTSFILMMLPLITSNKKLLRYQILLFYVGFAYYLLTAFSRIYGGAHYLTDTTFSGLFALMVYIIANEIYIRKVEKSFK